MPVRIWLPPGRDAWTHWETRCIVVSAGIARSATVFKPDNCIRYADYRALNSELRGQSVYCGAWAYDLRLAQPSL